MGCVHHPRRFGHVEALREVCPEMPEHGSKTSIVPVVWGNFGIFSARSKWFPVAIGDHGWNLVISLWTRDKATVSGVAAHPAPKIPSAKICWKSSCLDFLGSRQHPPHWLPSKGPNYQRWVLLISAGAIEGHFEGTLLWIWPRWTTNLFPRLKRQLQDRHFSSDAEVIAVAKTWFDR